ncbi:MAG: hypothetical protein LBP86_05060 [Azoarcus sp.]|jgi:hypothetical protein|nr:hypothetical protein [Azoarcus sp.]
MKDGNEAAGLSKLPEVWWSAWMRPWAAFGDWNALWGGPWRNWLESLAGMPVPWMPALAAERQGQPAAIDFFLPWLPRVEAYIEPLDSHSGTEAVRVMVRAILPGGLGGGDCLEVDATVRCRAADT